MADGYEPKPYTDEIKWKELQVTTDGYAGFSINLQNNGITRIVNMMAKSSSDVFIQKYKCTSTIAIGYIVSWDDKKVTNTSVNIIISYV